MRTVIKTIITTVLLSTLLVTVSKVEARLKYYRYNTNIPMVEMTLNMMVAMGVLEPIPSRLVHDGNPYNRLVEARYGRSSSNPYAYPASTRYSNRYRYDDYRDLPVSPYSRYYRSRYDYSPDPRYRSPSSRWNSSWRNRGNEPWSTWGNLSDYQWGSPWSTGYDSPWDNQWGSPWNTGYDSPWDNQWGSPWNTGYGSPWGNQWGGPSNTGYGSPWSSQWMNPWSSPFGYLGGWPYSSVYSTTPLSPDAILGNDWMRSNPYQSGDALQQNQSKSGDSSQQNQSKNGYNAEKTSWSGQPSRMYYLRGSDRYGKRKPLQKLNGLWIGENGEMLGIRGHRFLWYGDDDQYAKGELLKSPTMMKVRLEGSHAVIRYHYRLAGDELAIMSRDGEMRHFSRLSLMQPRHASARPHASYSNYHPESDTSYISRSMYRSGVSGPEAVYPPEQSETVTSPPEQSKHTESVAPVKYSAYASSSTRNLHAPYALRRSPDEPAEASNATAGDNTWGKAAPETTRDTYAATLAVNYSRHMTHKQWPATPYLNDSYSQVESFTPDTGNGDDIWQPLTPYSTSEAYPTAPFSANADTNSRSRRSSSAGPDMNDPNTYLYSYLKDHGNTHTPDSWKKSSLMNSTSTYPNYSHNVVSSTVSIKNDGSNIWKPNKSYPDRRRYNSNSQSGYSAQNTGWAKPEKVANSEVRKFVWSEPSPWN